MKKLNKYLTGFNLLIVLFGLLLLPFTPVVRLSVGKLPEQVLSFRTSKEYLSENNTTNAFSQVVTTMIVEASMSGVAKETLFSGVLSVENTGSLPKVYKVTATREFGEGNYIKGDLEKNAFFNSNSLDTVTLAPGKSDSVNLRVAGKSDKNFAKFIIVVLSSL